MSLSELTAQWVRSKLPKRPKDANKGTFGKVLVIAGSENYPGAAYLPCAACYRAGAGLVTLATIPVVQNIVCKKLPEVTFVVLPEEDGVIGEMALDVLFAKIFHDVILFGPGLDRKEQTAKFIYQLLKMGIGDLTFVIDGDGLNILSEIKEWDKLLENYGNSAVLTPHPGEMSRLTGLSIDEIQADREKVAQNFADGWGQVVVLKGANTIIASPTGERMVSPFANPILATAGTGDVLAGCIAGLIAQGLTTFDAACVGVYIHGLAGEMLTEKIGKAGALASDLLPLLPAAIAHIQT
ncbi:NAD(P)H-hydrate dehydratase [Candidatus Daviesbacteria bacterium]|nr:NAD(P)H-hydrate dehydratase [Candidatus Daviesbacteria bacterium]